MYEVKSINSTENSIGNYLVQKLAEKKKKEKKEKERILAQMQESSGGKKVIIEYSANILKNQ